MKMRKSAPLLGAFGLLAVVGAANATPAAPSSAKVQQVVLSDDEGVTNVAYQLHSPGRPGFWGKGAGAVGSHRHHRHR